MKTKISGLILFVNCLLQTACARPTAIAPLTSEAEQAARIKAKSAKVHTVLVTLSAGQIPNQNSADFSSLSQEPGDGESVAGGSSF